MSARGLSFCPAVARVRAVKRSLTAALLIASLAATAWAKPPRKKPREPAPAPAAVEPEPEPEPPPPAPPPPPPKPEAPPPPPPRRVDLDKPKTPYEVGLRVRYLFVTRLMLSPYLDASTQMLRAFSIGAEFVYHRKNFDVVTSLDYSHLGVDSGNWLSRNHDPSLDTNYMQFPKLGFFSADVSIIGHRKVTPWMQIRGGAGLGIGVVLGDVLVTSSSTACTSQNVNDTRACHPALAGWDTNRENALKQSEQPGITDDTAGNPHRHKSKDKPPAMAVLNLMIGARFFLPKKFTVEVELGFRNAMFFGVAAHHRF